MGGLMKESTIQMRLIRISVAAEVSTCASLRVALHVTKRHSDAQANHRLGVTGGTRCKAPSQEARCTEASALRHGAGPGG